jgi:nitrilase
MSVSEPMLVGVAQACPKFLDRRGSLEKALELIAEAGKRGLRLLVLPEAFIPGYPLWVWFVPPGETRRLRNLYARLLQEAVEVPGPETEALCRAANEAGVHVVIGVNERNAEASGASLYNTVLFIAKDGTLLGAHRKLMPTAGERLVHAVGDGSSLRTYDLDIGRLGGLICWENYMPLARFALYAQGLQIHAAPTWDRGEPWISSMRHIAKEGGCYVLSSCSAVHRDHLPEALEFLGEALPADRQWFNPGDSLIADPTGRIVAGPLHEREGLLTATLDPAMWQGPRFQLDVAGHYGRPDIFRLEIHPVPRTMLRPAAEASPPEPPPGSAGSGPEPGGETGHPAS